MRGIRVYDDFAHHPTAIATTVDGLRRRVGGGTHHRRARGALAHHAHGSAPDTLAPSLAGADQVWLYAPADLGWDVEAVARELGARGEVRREVDALARDLAGAVRSGDHVLIMSNGGFGGLHGKLLAALRQAPHP